MSAQSELTHAEGQCDLICVGGQNLNFGTNFVFFPLGLLHKLFIIFFLVIFLLIDIEMVENVVDDGVEPKPAIIEASVYVKNSTQTTVEAKATGVFKLHDKEVNTALFFTNDRRESEMFCLVDFVDKQQGRDLLYLKINLELKKNPILTLQCERSGVYNYKPPKTRKTLKLEGTGSRKCDCLFRICSYFHKKTNDW